MHTLEYSANFLTIIQHNGCQREEDSMEINLASLGQQVQSIMNQESSLLSNVSLKDTKSKSIIERHQNDIDTLTNALPGRKL